MIHYRTAKLSDLSKLREIEQHIIEVERPFNPSITPGKTQYYDLEDLIANDNSYVAVAEAEGMIVGTGYAQIRKSKASLVHEYHAYLGFMFVSPDHRRQGINQAILNELIAWSKSRHVFDLYLDVYSQNTGAIKAYQKVGFEPCLMEMKLNVPADTQQTKAHTTNQISAQS